MQAAGTGLVRQAVAGAAQVADIEEITAYQHDNHGLLIQQFFQADRATMLAPAAILRFKAAMADRRVLEALDHALTYWSKTRDSIPRSWHGWPPPGSAICLGQRTARHPQPQASGHVGQTALEAMVFASLTKELRTADIAADGAVEWRRSRRSATPSDVGESPHDRDWIRERFCPNRMGG